MCTVEGRRQYSADLGLEVPVKLKVTGNEKEVNNIIQIASACGGPACCNVVYVKE